MICKTLASRINKAIYDNIKFHLTLIICYYNYDECDTEQIIMNTLIQQTLIEFRENICYNDEIFNKYVSIYIPKDISKIVVHSKVFLFDEEKILYSTCNICDRSFYENGDLEGGIIIENKKTVKKLKKKLYSDFNRSSHLFCKFNFNNINHLQLFFIKQIYHLINSVFYNITNENIVKYSGIKLDIL